MNNFDWKFYIQNNLDLQKANINTEIKARKHWDIYGKNECRLKNKFDFLENELKNRPIIHYKYLNDIFDKIYVINLNKDKDRLNNIIYNSKIFNFEFLRIEGVNPVDKKYNKEYLEWYKKYIPDINFRNFDYKIYMNKYPDIKYKENREIKLKKLYWNHWIKYGKLEGRTLSEITEIANKGSWGCLYSHINILKDAINNNYNSILILEDDFMPHIRLNELTKKIDKVMKKKWKVIYLGTSQYEWDDIKKEKDYYYAKKSFGTFAYIVNRNFYEELLNEYKKFHHNADHILKDLQIKYPNDFLVIIPNLIISNLDLKSNTQTELNPKLYNKFKWNKYLYNYGEINKKIKELIQKYN
jgi:GR25 family glycosyltransferase involved in LPS biosynthesis